MTDMALMNIDPNVAISGAKARYQTLKNLAKEILVEGVDFGTIPGTDKPSLYKAGSEKLCSTFGLDPRFEILDKVENFNDEAGLFHYNIICRLIHVGSGAEIATGIGSCNSKESKYRWRWVQEDDIPAYLDKKILKKRDSSISEPQFAVEKAETAGKYGKPAEYWQQFKDAIANRTAYAGSRPTKTGSEMATWNIPSTSYRIPNDEIFSLANTIQKMACKRALVAATLIGTNASEFFTQDLEDLNDFGADFIVGKATPAPVISPTTEKIIVDKVTLLTRDEFIAAMKAMGFVDDAEIAAYLAKNNIGGDLGEDKYGKMLGMVKALHTDAPKTELTLPPAEPLMNGSKDKKVKV